MQTRKSSKRPRDQGQKHDVEVRDNGPPKNPYSLSVKEADGDSSLFNSPLHKQPLKSSREQNVKDPLPPRTPLPRRSRDHGQDSSQFTPPIKRHPIKRRRVEEDDTISPFAQTQTKEPSRRRDGEVSRARTVIDFPHPVIDLDLEYAYTSKEFRPKLGAFPRYSEGTVYIQLCQSEDKYCFALEASVLARASTWFAHKVKNMGKERDSQLAAKIMEETGYKYRFELVHDDKYRPDWVLKRVPFLVPLQAVGSVNVVSTLENFDSKRSIQRYQKIPPVLESVTSKGLADKQYGYDGTSDAMEVEQSFVADIGIPLHNSYETKKQDHSTSTAIKKEETVAKGERDKQFIPKASTPLPYLILPGAHMEIGKAESHSLRTIQSDQVKTEDKKNIDSAISAGVYHTVNPKSPHSNGAVENGDDIEHWEFDKPKYLIHRASATSCRPKSSIDEATLTKAEKEAQTMGTGFPLELTSMEELSPPTLGIKSEILEDLTTEKAEVTPQSKVAATENTSNTLTFGAKSPGTVVKESSTRIFKTSGGELPTEQLRLSHNAELDIDLDSALPKALTESGIPIEMCEVYRNFFLILHHLSPSIDTTNIKNARRHIELLCGTAVLYGSASLIRIQASNHLLNYGRNLFQAVLQDPPRWLFLACHLRCAPIFKEAMIHIVGQSPNWPWKTAQRSDFSSKVLALVDTKAAELSSLKVRINQKLFESNINIDGHGLTLFNLDNSSYGSWLIVQIWRDWFCHALTSISKKKQKVGKVYQLMGKANDVYLPPTKVFEALLDLKGKDFAVSNLKDLVEDMGMMKDYAKAKVKPLIANYSMLDVEEAGIEHLTCTKIENDELPWVKPTAD